MMESAENKATPPEPPAAAPRWQRLWRYTKHIAHDDELFIQSTAIKGGGVVAVMIGALYVIPAASGLPWILAAGVVGAGAVVIGVGVAGVAMGTGALVNSIKRIVHSVDENDVEKKMTLDEARKGLQKKFHDSGFAKTLRGWRISKYIGKTRVWKMTMKNWNRSQSFISDNGVFIKSFAVAGSAANIAAGIMMLASGTVLFPLILGGAATIATVGVAVGSIGWGLAAGYCLVKNVCNNGKEKDPLENPVRKKKENRRLRRLAAKKTKETEQSLVTAKPDLLKPQEASLQKGVAVESFTASLVRGSAGEVLPPVLATKKPSPPAT